MKKMITVIISIVFVSLSFISCTVTDGMVEQELTTEVVVIRANYFEDIGELATAADLIAIGKIGRVIAETEVKTGEARWGPIIHYYTDFSFKIEEVLKGKPVGEISLKQTGVAGKEEISDDPLFEIGEESVLFLHEYEEGKFYVLGGPQGRFNIIDGKVSSMNHILPDKVSLSTGLDVNRMDLEDFSNTVISNLGK